MFSKNFTGREAGESASAAPSANAKMNVVSLVLGFVGFAVSLYALILHLQTKTSAGTLTCDVSENVNCSKVIGGEYGELAGMPLGAFGMSYFGIVIALAFLPAFLQASASWMARRQLLVATVGAVVSLYLAYLSYFKINAVCLVCSSVHAVAVLNFVWTLVSFVRVRREPQVVAEGGFLKMLAASLALAVPPLLVGALLPTLSSAIGKTDKAPAAESSAKAEPSGKPTPFPAEWVQVARSNYVGKGEDYRIGSDQAKVVVHMFSDMQCPHCKTASEAITLALSAVGSDRVLFVYRNYPLSNKCNRNMAAAGHSFACDMAMAARCAGSQKKEAFWTFKTWAFSGIDMSPVELEQQFSMAGFSEQAKKQNLDVARFESCMKDKVELAKIEDDIDLGKKMGLTGTPLIVINGRKYSGEISPQGMTTAFRDALEAN